MFVVTLRKILYLLAFSMKLYDCRSSVNETLDLNWIK